MGDWQRLAGNPRPTETAAINRLRHTPRSPCRPWVRPFCGTPSEGRDDWFTALRCTPWLVSAVDGLCWSLRHHFAGPHRRRPGCVLGPTSSSPPTGGLRRTNFKDQRHPLNIRTHDDAGLLAEPWTWARLSAFLATSFLVRRSIHASFAERQCCGWNRISPRLIWRRCVERQTMFLDLFLEYPPTLNGPCLGAMTVLCQVRNTNDPTSAASQ